MHVNCAILPCGDECIATGGACKCRYNGIARGSAAPVTPLTDLLGVALQPGGGGADGAAALSWLQGLPYVPATNFLSPGFEGKLEKVLG